jgi:hypothetical protein
MGNEYSKAIGEMAEGVQKSQKPTHGGARERKDPNEGRYGTGETVNNLASAIRKHKLEPADLTDRDLQLLAMNLILDAPEDMGDLANHGRLKLDALQFIQKVRVDGKPKEVAGADDFGTWKATIKAERVRGDDE